MVPYDSVTLFARKRQIAARRNRLDCVETYRQAHAADRHFAYWESILMLVPEGAGFNGSLKGKRGMPARKPRGMTGHRYAKSVVPKVPKLYVAPSKFARHSI